MKKNELKAKIKKLSIRLAYYRSARNYNGKKGLDKAMKRDSEYSYEDLCKKMNDFVDRLNEAIDSGDTEIGNSIIEFNYIRKLLDL